MFMIALRFADSAPKMAFSFSCSQLKLRIRHVRALRKLSLSGPKWRHTTAIHNN